MLYINHVAWTKEGENTGQVITVTVYTAASQSITTPSPAAYLLYEINSAVNIPQQQQNKT